MIFNLENFEGTMEINEFIFENKNQHSPMFYDEEDYVNACEHTQVINLEYTLNSIHLFPLSLAITFWDLGSRYYEYNSFSVWNHSLRDCIKL